MSGINKNWGLKTQYLWFCCITLNHRGRSQLWVWWYHCWGKLQADCISAWVHQVGLRLAWRQLIECTRWRRSCNQEVWRHSLTGQWESSVWAVWEEWLQSLDFGKGDCRTKAWFKGRRSRWAFSYVSMLPALWTNYVVKCRLKCKVLNKLCD